MHVLALAVDLRLPGLTSLKEKRSVIRPILEGARRRFLVSAAEVDAHDRHQRSLLGFVAVAESASRVRAIIDQVERFVWSFPEVEVVSADRHWLELG